MKTKVCIELFSNLFDYPTLALLDKTVACQNVLEKESPESARRLGIFLKYLFDTRCYDLEYSFTRSPHRRVLGRLRQCYAKFRSGLMNSERVGFTLFNKNQLSEDFNRFIKNLPSLEIEDEINYVITNFIFPALHIIRNHFEKTIMLANEGNPNDKKNNQYSFIYKHAFDALSSAMDEKDSPVDSDVSLLDTLPINPLFAIQNKRVATNLSFISNN